jgi:hypothetical protein
MGFSGLTDSNFLCYPIIRPKAVQAIDSPEIRKNQCEGKAKMEKRYLDHGLRIIKH